MSDKSGGYSEKQLSQLASRADSDDSLRKGGGKDRLKGGAKDRLDEGVTEPRLEVNGEDIKNLDKARQKEVLKQITSLEKIKPRDYDAILNWLYDFQYLSADGAVSYDELDRIVKIFEDHRLAFNRPYRGDDTHKGGAIDDFAWYLTGQLSKLSAGEKMDPISLLEIKQWKVKFGIKPKEEQSVIRKLRKKLGI